jgi:hypothetical protein
MTEEQCKKLKVGDIVQCTNNKGYDTNGAFVVGKYYIIRESGISWVRVVRDSNGIKNGWGAEFFELVKGKLAKVLYG